MDTPTIEMPRHEAEAAELLLHFRQCDQDSEFIAQLAHNRVRRSRRCHDHVPGRGLEARHAGFGDGRHIRQGIETAGRGDAERPHFVVAHQRHSGARIGKDHLHVAGDDVAQRRRRALVGNVRHLNPGHGLEQLAGEVDRVARTARRECQLAGLLLGQPDQVGDRLYRQRRVDHQHQREACRVRHKGKVLHRVVGQVPVKGRVDGQRAAWGDQYGVAVRRGFGDRRGRNHAAGAWFVFNDEWLAEPLGQSRPKRARHDIGRCPRRECHHDSDGVRRIILRV